MLHRIWVSETGFGTNIAKVRGQAVHSLDGGTGKDANGVAATGKPVEMARLTLIHPHQPKSCEQLWSGTPNSQIEFKT